MPSQKQAKAIQAHHQIKPNPLKSKPKKPPKSIIFAFFWWLKWKCHHLVVKCEEMRENGREQRRERQLKKKKKLIYKYYNVCVYLDKYNSTCKILNNKGFVL